MCVFSFHELSNWQEHIGVAAAADDDAIDQQFTILS